MKHVPQIIELADGTKCVYLEDFRRECDEAQAAIRALAEHGESEIQRITKERDEAQEAFLEVRKHREQLNSLLQGHDACWDEIKAALGEPEKGDQTCDLDRVLKAIREAKAIAKEAITGLYTLGDYDLANRLTSKLEEPK